MEIFVRELPKRCDDCPFYKLDTYVDVFRSVINSHECVLDGSMITGDCPLKPLTDRLAEERKMVVKEAKKLVNDGFLTRFGT